MTFKTIHQCPLLAIVIFSVNLVGCPSQGVERLNAVSYYTIPRVLYNRVRNTDRLSEVPQNIDLETKKQICHHITNSSTFKLWREYEVVPEEHYDDLQRTHPHIIDSLYETSSQSNKHGMVYTNRSKVLHVLFSSMDITKTVQERVFVCLTRSELDDTYTEYFISEEYNVNDTPQDEYVAGRFIFKRLSDGQLWDVAMAEESAKVLSADYERVYIQRRQEHEPVALVSDNSICKLNEMERLRVCAVVFSSIYFENTLLFSPSPHNVDEHVCIKKEVSFRTDNIRMEVMGRRYEEWMIRCLTHEYHSSTPYYLSQAYTSNEVFVYRSGNFDLSKIFIENLTTGVRFRSK